MCQFSKDWLTESADPIVGIDQTALLFATTLRKAFLDSESHDEAMEARYDARSPMSANARFENISSEIKKFQRSLPLVMSSNPTQTTEAQVLSLAIAIHVGKIKKMSYDFKDFNHDIWHLHFAYKVDPCGEQAS